MSTFSAVAQSLHHQMISAQGINVHASNGVVMKQSIGQQSVIGNYSGSQFSVGQGFIQGAFSKFKGSSELNIQITTFPNPFTSKINFQFTDSIDGLIKIHVYDAMGKIVLTAEKEMLSKSICLENLNFPVGQYIVNLSSKNFSYTTHLLKMQ